jgi:hypothetical protein
VTTAYADLPSAMLGRLRSMPTVVSAFAEDTSLASTTKFWADFAPAGVILPWAVYEEVDGDIQYMTPRAGHVASIETGQVRWTIVGEGRRAVRDLGRVLATVLDDAPLEFAGGQLMEIRARKPFFAPVRDLAPGTPHAVARVVVFDYMLSRTT